jgi:hypothetical protein
MLKYGENWVDTDPLLIELTMIRESDEYLKSAGTNRLQHYLNAHKLLWPEDEQHRWFVKGLKSIVENKVSVFLGSASCVSGDTRILNPLTGEQPTIRELYEKQIAPTVLTLAGAAQAGIPFIKGEEDLYEVVLENGQRFKATASHRVLATNGDFCHVSNLRFGSLILSYEQNLQDSNSEHNPLTLVLNVPDSLKKVASFQENYSACSCPDDERLLPAAKNGQSSFPSQDDALKYKAYASGGGDDQDNTPSHNRPCRLFYLPSKRSGVQPFCSSKNLASRHARAKTFLHDAPQFQSDDQFHPNLNRTVPFQKPTSDFYGTHYLDEVLFSGISHQQPLKHSESLQSSCLTVERSQPNLCSDEEKETKFENPFSRSVCNNESYRFKVSQSRVVSITKSHKETFYDLCVPNVHHYFAEGAIHHNSGKTYLMAAHCLITFWAFPFTSFALVSSTDMRSLDQKIWGRGIKWLFNRARERYPWLDGYLLESARAIVPDRIDDEGQFARLLSRGIACVPCISGGRFVGMGKYQGVKAPSSPGQHDGLLTHYGDESAVMETSYLDAYTNWTVDDNFKGVQSGNPTDISDPLCTAAEPIGGWDSFVDNGKTQEWTSRWHDAHVVAFDGRDTPNNDQAETKYHFLISKPFIEGLRKTYGDDSWQLYQQGIGKPSKGMVSNRVITIGLCEQHHAFDSVVWKGTPRTKLYALDPAYGGGDRCVGGECEYGEDKDGNIIFSVGTPEIIPIRLNASLDAEGQIAEFIKQQSDRLGIPPKNIFYDSFGRGTLGSSFAKQFGFNCPIPVDSGARPTDRPVRFDLFVDDGKNGKRLKRCDEQYQKFVTELWYSMREAIESDQVRDLPMEVAQEGQCRLFKTVAGNKIEVEPKEDMKERLKKSPDLMDWCCVALEGARQLGFQIQRIGRNVINADSDENYFTKEAEEWDNAIKAGLLKH